MGGVFWKYFRDELALPLIRRTGALAAIAQGWAAMLDQARQDILWLRDQFNPATCEEQYLVHYGNARGVIRHRLESVGQFRTRVVNAYTWQMLGGKVGGLPKILAHYGFIGATIINLRHEDPLRWAEFRVELPPQTGGYLDDDYELLAWQVNENKPARSKLASVRINRTVRSELRFAGVLMMQPKITIGLQTPGVSVAGTTFNFAGGVKFTTRITIG